MSSEKRNLPASIHQRLLNKDHATGQTFNELIQYYTIERLSYTGFLSLTIMNNSH